MMMEKVAIGVGTVFSIVTARSVGGITLRPTGVLVCVDKETYMLYKATTFEESQKVDRLFDGINTLSIKDYAVSNNGA